jgi:hypothetical protein
VLLVLGLIYLIYSRTAERRPTYTLSEPWTHDPILWAATGEVVPGGDHEHANVVNVGGGASGRW